MMDRSPKISLFLISISALICLTLVAGMFFFYQEGKQPKGYQHGNSPEAVAYNYLMALVKEDFNLAYGYLSPNLPGYPENIDAFIADLKAQGLLPAYEIDPCVYFDDVDIFQDQAEVELRMQYYDPCLRGWWMEVKNLSYTPGHIKLEKDGETWKIVDADDRFFFSGCWSDLGRCNSDQD